MRDDVECMYEDFGKSVRKEFVRRFADMAAQYFECDSDRLFDRLMSAYESGIADGEDPGECIKDLMCCTVEADF